jgi:hypothetical protein
MKNTTIQTCLAAAVGCAAAIVLAADVPWVFTGDTSRQAAYTSAATLSSFTSWTHEASAETSPAAKFSSFQPGTVFFIR